MTGRPEDDAARPSANPEWNGEGAGDPDAQLDQGADAGPLYQPSGPEASRGRMQGLGMGQSDLDAQADPTGARTEREFRERTNTSSEMESEEEVKSHQDRGDLRH